MFDWLKRIFHTLIPDIPSPFSWISTYIRLYVWDPLKRTFSEAENGLGLINGEVESMWTNRDWYITRLRIKWNYFYQQAIQYADQVALSVVETITLGWKQITDFLSQLIQGIRDTLDWVVEHGTTAFNNFIAATWNNFVVTYNQVVAVLNWAVGLITGLSRDTFVWLFTLWTNYSAVVNGLVTDP